MVLQFGESKTEQEKTEETEILSKIGLALCSSVVFIPISPLAQMRVSGV